MSYTHVDKPRRSADAPAVAPDEPAEPPVDAQRGLVWLALIVGVVGWWIVDNVPW